MSKYCLIATLVLLLPAEGRAQNREYLQLSAEVRMLQEDVGRLTLANNQLGEQLKAATARIDELAAQGLKRAADENVKLDQALSGLAALRERAQAGDVRAAENVQEMKSVHEALRALTDQINALASLLQSPSGAPAGPVSPVRLDVPASRIYSAAFGDYMGGRYESAIEGFREVIEKYPTSPEAADGQFGIGEALRLQGRWREALAEYQKLIASYKDSQRLAEAYYSQGLCYAELDQPTSARQMFETVVAQYPGTTPALQSQQKLQRR